MIESLRSIPFDDLSTVKKVLGRVKHDKGGNTYQGVLLTRFEQGVTFFRSHKNEVVEKVLTCLEE